jgi:hypothetical protein
MKDMFGEELKVGDYFAYAELRLKHRAVQNIYQVVGVKPRFNASPVLIDGVKRFGSKFVKCAQEKAILLKDFKENV